MKKDQRSKIKNKKISMLYNLQPTTDVYTPCYNVFMLHVWDYNVEDLKKSKRGRLLLLERQINYGVDENEKINFGEVKRNWDKLQIMSPRRKRLFEFLIWENN